MGDTLRHPTHGWMHPSVVSTLADTYRPTSLKGATSLLHGQTQVPGPSLPCTVRALPGRLSGLSVSHSKSVLYGAFVWARRALSQKRRFPARTARALHPRAGVRRRGSPVPGGRDRERAEPAEALRALAEGSRVPVATDRRAAALRQKVGRRVHARAQRAARTGDKLRGGRRSRGRVDCSGL
jgi:hypothetical protein